jgi:hypothetical protein
LLLHKWLEAAEAFDDTCRFIARPQETRAHFLRRPLGAASSGFANATQCGSFFQPRFRRSNIFKICSELARARMQPFSIRHFSLSKCSWKYWQRTSPTKAAKTLSTLSHKLWQMHLRDTPGNHLVFCPSMAYLEQLRGNLESLLPTTNFLFQRSAMDEAERRAFLDAFESNTATTALAVLGGIFAEGIDLPGDKLVGVTVIGTGLPRLSLEGDILQAHFEKTRGNGFDYAYRFPGMQRVLQAVGRLIRSETDFGSALLVDRRFLESRHRILFPSWWRISRTIKP